MLYPILTPGVTTGRFVRLYGATSTTPEGGNYNFHGCKSSPSFTSGHMCSIIRYCASFTGFYSYNYKDFLRLSFDFQFTPLSSLPGMSEN